MAKDKQQERQRDRARDRDTLHAAAHSDGTCHGTNRRIRRLIDKGWATAPRYDIGGVKLATATITDAGRAEVLHHHERTTASSDS